MVQSLCFLRNVRVFPWLSAHGRGTSRGSLVFYKVNFFPLLQLAKPNAVLMDWSILDRDKKRLSWTVTKGFGYLIRYYLGTIAFGALIIGIVRLVRAMISFVQNRLKKFDNDLVRGILWCCQCCLWCFECALKFLTRNAYIETGTSLRFH